MGVIGSTYLWKEYVPITYTNDYMSERQIDTTGTRTFITKALSSLAGKLYKGGKTLLTE